MDDLISRQVTIAQPENTCENTCEIARTANDCISRQAAIDAAIEAADEWDGGYNLTRASMIANAINNIAPSAQPEQRWIPCKKQMPEPDSWAIWCSKKGLIQVARWKEDAIDHFWPGQGFFELEDAVAWMPLPESYRGDEHEND